MNELINLEKFIDYSFKNKALLKEAMTHPTFAKERRLKYDNQRLEFLGDSVIQLILTEAIFHAHRNEKEGIMTKSRSMLVREKTLAFFARLLQINNYILLGNGEKMSGGNMRDSTLSDAFEALIGAIYCDVGFEVTKHKVLGWVLGEFPDLMVDDDNPKGALQEYVAQKIGKPLMYDLISEEGLEHEKQYKIAVYLGGKLLAEGVGRRRKIAEAMAAKDALDLLKSDKIVEVESSIKQG